jgi:hypothetical protein
MAMKLPICGFDKGEVACGILLARVLIVVNTIHVDRQSSLPASAATGNNAGLERWCANDPMPEVVSAESAPLDQLRIVVSGRIYRIRLEPCQSMGENPAES